MNKASIFFVLMVCFFTHTVMCRKLIFYNASAVYAIRIKITSDSVKRINLACGDIVALDIEYPSIEIQYSLIRFADMQRFARGQQYFDLFVPEKGDYLAVLRKTKASCFIIPLDFSDSACGQELLQHVDAVAQISNAYGQHEKELEHFRDLAREEEGHEEERDLNLFVNQKERGRVSRVIDFIEGSARGFALAVHKGMQIVSDQFEDSYTFFLRFMLTEEDYQDRKEYIDMLEDLLEEIGTSAFFLSDKKRYHIESEHFSINLRKRIQKSIDRARDFWGMQEEYVSSRNAFKSERGASACSCSQMQKDREGSGEEC